MPQLCNIEKSVILKVTLINDKSVDIKSERNDYENWIPFNFSVSVDKETYQAPKDTSLMFTVYELQNFILGLHEIVDLKSKGLLVKDYEFTSSESSFEMRVYDTFEVEELYIDFWMNIGNLTSGKHYGYDIGVRFVVSLDSMVNFINDLKQSFEEIISITKKSNLL